MLMRSLESPSALRRPLAGLKYLLVGALTLSSLAFAQPPMHGAVPVGPPSVRYDGSRFDDDTRFGNDIRFDDDTRRASELLRAFDEAAARRDVRALGHIERRFSFFLDQEQREARMSRTGRGMLHRLNRIESELERLQGRMKPRALSARRDLYAELVRLADGRVGRRF